MLTIDLLTISDVPQALQLSQQANWNQTPADWIRLITLWPESCFAGRSNGELVATATVAMYPPSLGWIGMVLVNTRHRGRGYGGAMFDSAIRYAQAAGIQTLGLDATDQGRSIYAKRGFRETQTIHRWHRAADIEGSELTDAMPMRATDLSTAESLDFQATGWNRSRLLQYMISESGSLSVEIADQNHLSEINAFGFARPGRYATQIGPLIASNITHAATILDQLLAKIAQTHGLQDIIVDALDNSEMHQVLATRKFQIHRKLARMLLSSTSLPAISAANRVACGFEVS